jgi:hypothetical protein
MQQGPKLHGERAPDLHWLVCYGLSERQLMTVQERPGQAVDGFTPIARVSNDRPIGHSQLVADLVMATSDQFQVKECVSPSIGDRAESGQGVLAAPFRRDRRRQVAWHSDDSLHQSQVMLDRFASHNHFAQLTDRCAAFTEEHRT